MQLYTFFCIFLCDSKKNGCNNSYCNVGNSYNDSNDNANRNCDCNCNLNPCPYLMSKTNKYVICKWESEWLAIHIFELVVTWRQNSTDTNRDSVSLLMLDICFHWMHQILSIYGIQTHINSRSKNEFFSPIGIIWE